MRCHAVFLVAFIAVNAVSCLQPICKPQGLLTLDKPYPPAQYGQLPFCEQYSCSCCNRTHALLIYKSLASLEDEPDFGSECREYLRTFSCSVCDPEVGVGLKPTACAATCDRWYAACRGHFFGYDPHTQHLVPCTEQRASQGLHICSRLEQLVPDGAALCRTAGFQVHSLQAADAGPRCFDGSPNPSALPFCKHPGEPPKRAPRRRRSSSTRAGSRTPGAPQLDTLTWFVLVGALSVAFTTLLPQALGLYHRWHQQRLRGAALLRGAQQQQQQQQQLGQGPLGRLGLREARAVQQEQLRQAAEAASGKAGGGGLD